jgi:DNA primase
MALFPQTFLDDLKAQTDIVSVVGEVVPLRKTGATFKGLCPFHEERTPSFNVNAEKGFFKCFGCGAGGDVFKFVEMHQKLSFPEVVRHLASRAGIQVPESADGPEDRAAIAEREAILGLHEQAGTFFREQLHTPAGARARKELESRGLKAATIEMFGYGFAPAAGRHSLHARFAEQKVPVALQVKSGLVMEREGRRLVDRFRNRLTIPIARDSGVTVAFGGRALEAGQVPKYLNSPETPVYSKSRTLYGLNVTKSAVRQFGYCVLVEGYFDLAQVWQAGVQPVAALCGTALTAAQSRILKRFSSKVVISFDPDAAGRGAAARSSELLVAEGFQVNVALLPDGSDPDAFIRARGGKAYAELLRSSRPYLEFLLDRAASGVDLNRPEGRRKFLGEMLGVAATIPDAAARDQFADRLAHKARITEGVIRDEIRKAAAERRRDVPALAVQTGARLRPAEQGLLWALVHRPVEGLAAVARLDEEDFEGLFSAAVLRLAASLADVPPDVLPNLLHERLSEGERALLDRASSADSPVAEPADCVQALKRLRWNRELAAVQRAIEELQERRAADSDELLPGLWARKKELLQRLEHTE